MLNLNDSTLTPVCVRSHNPHTHTTVCGCVTTNEHLATRARTDSKTRQAGTYVAHLPHDGFLFLTEVVLIVLRNLLVQVLMDFEHLMADAVINVEQRSSPFSSEVSLR